VIRGLEARIFNLVSGVASVDNALAMLQREFLAVR